MLWRKNKDTKIEIISERYPISIKSVRILDIGDGETISHEASMDVLIQIDRVKPDKEDQEAYILKFLEDCSHLINAIVYNGTAKNLDEFIEKKDLHQRMNVPNGSNDVS